MARPWVSWEVTQGPAAGYESGGTAGRAEARANEILATDGSPLLLTAFRVPPSLAAARGADE